jgi:hypothetical protein
MAKMRIVFDVDTGQLFDSIAAMQGDWSPLVQRMAGLMMTGEACFRDAVGMAFYGVEVASIQRTDLARPSTEGDAGNG